MAVDFYLQLDGIEGEATTQGFEKQIKIHSFSWGAAQHTSVSGSGGSASGKASLSDLSIMKDLDKASPEVFKAILTGKHITTGVLSAAKSTGDTTGKVFLKITLGEVFITSQQISGSSEIPSESVSMSYNTIKEEYFAQGEDGTLTSTGAISYDLKTNVTS